MYGNESYGEPKSWLVGENHSPPPPSQCSSAAANASTTGRSASLDRDLYNDLVEIVPLVQSLIDRKATSSYTRRGSMIYTKTPSRESLNKKNTDAKGRNAAKIMPGKKQGGHGDGGQASNIDEPADGFSVFSSADMAAQKESEDVVALRQQVEDLQKKLLEKDDLLSAVENSKNQMTSIQAKFDELKRHAAEKDSLMRSAQLQLSDARIKLADKQAELEKVQWEAKTSNKKVEKLQEEIDSVQAEVSSFMLLLEGLSKNNSDSCSGDYEITLYHPDHVPYIDGVDGEEMHEMEDLGNAYIAAVAAAREKQDEESLDAAVNVRLHLQSLLFRTNISKNNPDAENLRAPAEAFHTSSLGL